MKTVLFLSILIAASIAAPQTRSAFDKLKDNNFLSKLQPDSNGFYSKESFGYVLAILNSLLNQSDSAFVPEEIRSFVANLTVEDYEAIKYLHSFGTRIGSGNITGSEMVNSSLTFMTRHPDFNRRMQSSLFGLLRRLKELSSTTKGYMVNSYLLIKHPASKKPMGRGLTLVRYYLTWPQENRDEFELIFPKLSEKASALTPLFNLYKDEFSYPSDLPDCAASDEKPVRCSKFINAMNFEMFLGKDTDMDELEQLKKDLNEIMKAIVVLAILVGVSLAAPISTLYKLEERVFSSKDYFEKYLKMMHSSLDDYKDVIIPKDIYEFLKTLTVDDYEPMKMVNQIDIGDMYEMILRSHVIKTLYPDFHKRWETAGIGFLHSLQKLPTSTKNRVVNMFSLAAHIKSDNAKLGEVALKYYLSWPKENKDDLDEVFPRLSSEVEKVVAITGEDEPFKLPEGTDCSVEGKKTSVCIVMKWILFISLFGVALASEFAINRPLKAAISRDEFARSLEALNTIVDVVEGKYIPDEIVTIIRSLKVDDYEALEYVRLSNFTLSEELIYDFKELFPHVYNLFLHEGGKLYSRIKELSNSTRDLCVEFTKAQAAFQEVEPVMYLKMIATTFLSWPLENQREFDTIVPGFSNLLKTYLPFFDALLMADSASSKEDLDRNAEPIESFSYRLNRFEEL